MKATVVPLVIGKLGWVTKGMIQGQEDSEKKETKGDHVNHSIIKIG